MRTRSHRITFPSDMAKSTSEPITESAQRYLDYRDATTTVEFFEKGGTSADLRWDLQRGICKFVDPDMERLRLEYAAESAHTSRSLANRKKRGGVLASEDMRVEALNVTSMGLSSSFTPSSHPRNDANSSSHSANSLVGINECEARFAPSVLEQAINLMTDEELEQFAYYVDQLPDIQLAVQRAVTAAHSRVLGMSERTYEDLQRGLLVPDVWNNPMCLCNMVHDTMNDSFVCHYAGHFCLDPDCDHTCCVPDELVLGLVAPDDIEVVAEETIGLDKYTPAQREEFIKCTVKELQGLADIGTFEEASFVPRGKKLIPSKHV